MQHIAIIGGSGFEQIDALKIIASETVMTAYGAPSDAVIKGAMFGKTFTLLRRHGAEHSIAPHKINYRANIMALKDRGVQQIIALAAVGGIAPGLTPGDIVIPEQIIDYTWGREHTFYDATLMPLRHIEFTNPYSSALRQRLLQAAASANVTIQNTGVYAATQGPRFESAAEIDRLQKDGATIVGMTGMPEAALAAELDIDYACIAIVVNAAAGRSEVAITMQHIRQELDVGVAKALAIIEQM